jgi:ATP-binding cassette subfamily B protein
VAAALGISAAQNLLLPVTLLFGLAAVLAAAVRLLNLWLNGRLAAAIGSDLSCDAYKRTLYQPYAEHVQHNSSGVITAITTQTLQVVQVPPELQVAAAYGLTVRRGAPQAALDVAQTLMAEPAQRVLRRLGFAAP